MYILRKAQATLEEFAQSDKVLLVLGARQVGKTTLVQRFLQSRKTIFLNLDVEVDKDRFLAASFLSPEEAVRSFGNPEYIVIDEAQRLLQTSQIVKGWYDAHLSAKIILLGSSNLNLLNQSAESLTGRNKKIFLPPLLFKEVVASESWYSTVYSDEDLQTKFSKQIESLLFQNLVFGSYPEAVTTGDKSAYLLNLVSDYILKDVFQLGLVKTPETIRKLLLLLAHQAGSEVSINELAMNLAISRITVERYLELLEQTFIIFRLPAFSTNQRKEINKSQKIYFWDTGIRNSLLKEFSLSPYRSDIGRLWENWVVAEFAKYNILTGEKANLYFWRSRTGSEVDLVIKSGEIIRAYEVKWKKQTIHKKVFEDKYQVKVESIDSTCPIVQWKF